MIIVPQLWKRHPNFFLSYLGTAFFHLALWQQQVFNPEGFSAPVFKEMKTLMSIEAWGWSSFIIWGFMTVGVYTRFSIGRIGLVLGFMLMIVRGLLLNSSPLPGGSAVPIYFFIALQHLAQAGEPERNPLTEKSVQ